MLLFCLFFPFFSKAQLSIFIEHQFKFDAILLNGYFLQEPCKILPQNRWLDQKWTGQSAICSTFTGRTSILYGSNFDHELDFGTSMETLSPVIQYHIFCSLSRRCAFLISVAYLNFRSRKPDSLRQNPKMDIDLDSVRKLEKINSIILDERNTASLFTESSKNHIGSEPVNFQALLNLEPIKGSQRLIWKDPNPNHQTKRTAKRYWNS